MGFMKIVCSGWPYLICPFCFCALFKKLTVAFILRRQMGLTDTISIVNWIFGFCFIRKYVLLFFMDFKLLLSHNTIVKISAISNKWNLLKHCSQTTDPIDLCIFAAIFTMRKMEMIKFKNTTKITTLNRRKHLVHTPASILRKSTSDRHRPVSYPDGPMTAQYRFT